MYPQYAFPGPYHSMMLPSFPPMIHPGLHPSHTLSSSLPGRPQQFFSRPRQVRFGRSRTNFKVDQKQQHQQSPISPLQSSSAKVVSSPPVKSSSMPHNTCSIPTLVPQTLPLRPQLRTLWPITTFLPSKGNSRSIYDPCLLHNPPRQRYDCRIVRHPQRK